MSDSLLNGEVDSAALEEVRPPSPPLLRPHAATVVPEERLDNAASVAVAMPVALLHPPPSLHILPPTPELQRAHRGSLSPAANHEAAELSLTLLEKSSSEDVSPLTLESSDTDIFIYSLSDLTDDRDTPLSPETAPLPLWPSALPLVSSDYNNNPRTPPQTSGGEAVGSSNHSADSIDFFSAREKFLTLAKDRRTRTLSEQAQQRTPQSTDEETEANDEEDDHKGKMSQDSPQSEESSDQPPSHHHDNAVSVRHIITEIEAISHPASSLSPPPSLHLPVQADPPEELDSSHTPQDSSSPSMLPCDWPPGSVRRATEQLEQKLRQELEMAAVSQRSPLHSPNTEQPPLLLTPPSPSRAEPSPVVHKEQRAKFSSVSAEPKEKLLGSQTEPHRLQSSGPTNTSIHQVSGTLPVDVLMPENSHINKSHVSTRHLAESSVDTSTQSQRLPLLCSDLQTVGGVTEQELHTDSSLSDDESRLAPGPQELERIQQTLSELQAFLHESVAPGPLMDTMDSELVPPGLEGEQQLRGRLGGRSLMELTGYHRACELEARIRQAGLTPPSLMKRSASLAKLDCLELSANDLSDLDLRTYVRAPSQPSSPHLQDFYSQPQSHPDDIWKKQKVLTQINCVSQSSPSSLVCPKQDTPERGDAEGGGISVTSSTRQQVRGHPSRRSRRASTEKKLRAAAMLYNTM
uniref:Uncharacterized protein n=2 Tax=Gouania willdenowi TaxID=441366 RepID=A0A8C5N6E9_GOUWI